MHMHNGHQSHVLTKNIQAMKMNALPSRERNNRSPRVVSIANTPLLRFPPGEKYSQTPMAAMQVIMKMKNAAVARVQAIHEPRGSVHQSAEKTADCNMMRDISHTLPRAKPFAM